MVSPAIGEARAAGSKPSSVITDDGRSSVLRINTRFYGPIPVPPRLRIGVCCTTHNPVVSGNPCTTGATGPGQAPKSRRPYLAPSLRPSRPIATGSSSTAYRATSGAVDDGFCGTVGAVLVVAISEAVAPSEVVVSEEREVFGDSFTIAGSLRGSHRTIGTRGISGTLSGHVALISNDGSTVILVTGNTVKQLIGVGRICDDPVSGHASRSCSFLRYIRPFSIVPTPVGANVMLGPGCRGRVLVTDVEDVGDSVSVGTTVSRLTIWRSVTVAPSAGTTTFTRRIPVSGRVTRDLDVLATPRTRVEGGTPSIRTVISACSAGIFLRTVTRTRNSA